MFRVFHLGRLACPVCDINGRRNVASEAAVKKARHAWGEAQRARAGRKEAGLPADHGVRVSSG